MTLPRLPKIRRVRLDKPLPLVKLLPNLVTLVGLAIGMSSIRFALDGRWEAAVICVLFATFMDALDGKIARMLNATSIFGAE
jgi:CDP-diacylglycerol--serine O-phosphatidyltransferase